MKNQEILTNNVTEGLSSAPPRQRHDPATTGDVTSDPWYLYWQPAYASFGYE
jgi:hypothetical protein